MFSKLTIYSININLYYYIYKMVASGSLITNSKIDEKKIGTIFNAAPNVNKYNFLTSANKSWTYLKK